MNEKPEDSIALPKAAEDAGRSGADKAAETQADFFAQNGAFFSAYAGDSSLEIKRSPSTLGTFAIDLQKGVLYAEPKFWKEEEGFGESDKVFGTLHEFEHFREMRELIQTEGGLEKFKKHIAKFKNRRRFAVLDNCVDDIKMNRSVVERAAALTETKTRLYEQKLFPEDDMTGMPKHLQFSQALLREAMLPERQTKVSDDVRAELERIKAVKSGGVSLMDFMTDPTTPMEIRLKLQERFLEPVMEKFFKEDAENISKEKEGENGERGEVNGVEKEGKEAAEGEESKSEDEEEGKSKGKKKNEKKRKTQKEKSGKKDKPENPEDYFKDKYDEYFKNHPEALPTGEIEKAVKKYEEAKKNEKSPAELAEEAYAKAEGVTVNELREYRRFLEELEEIKNPETNETVIEEIREIFRKVIAERKKKILKSKLPVEEGDLLAFPAEAHISVESGNLEPRVWETVDWKERPKELFGEFDVTLLCDRSGSMERGGKKIEQRKAATLVLEALKEFSDDLDEEWPRLEYDLNVRSEVWTFGDDTEVEMLKPLGKELSEKQRVLVYNKLGTAPGDSTKDFSALEKIKDGVLDEDWKRIEAQKTKKLIIVLTDGESDNPAEVKKLLEQFRDRGAVVVGVGITADGASAVTTYAPDGFVCERVENLAAVLGELLEKHIMELNRDVKV